MKNIIKRDGRVVAYHNEKIADAIAKAMFACGRTDKEESVRIAKLVEEALFAQFPDTDPGVEQVQDIVETVLMENGFALVAKTYILYRAERTKVRVQNTRLMKIYDELTFKDALSSDMKRDNANIDGDTAMGMMLKYGSEGAKDYYSRSLLTPEQDKAHSEGDIHIHDFDFYGLTTTCCQIDILKLFKDGFSTGHGYLREPNDIQSYAALACIAIQANQNDQHGGQSIPSFDYGLAPGVAKTYRKRYLLLLSRAVELLCPESGLTHEKLKELSDDIHKRTNLSPRLGANDDYLQAEAEVLSHFITDKNVLSRVQVFAVEKATAETDKATYQAMEALVHNLNTMHSRCGAQVPFSSINYGLDCSPEGRMVTKNVLLATEAGLGCGETAIFPIHIFRVKEGINYNTGEPNYDLFKLACRVSAKRLFPNFSFMDAPFNLQYYREGHPETEVAYMGCRTRVIGNVYDRDNEIVTGRGNLSFTSINLPRIAINAHGNLDRFFADLENKLELVAKQLMDRYHIQSKKRVRNFPFLMGQGLWLGSDKLGINDEVGEVLRHGTLSIGFIGLAETLKSLIGSHHGETQQARNLGLEIVRFMRDFCDKKSRELQMNFTLLATPAEGLAGRFVAMDRKKYGSIPGVTDRKYYTNSFHVPVYYDISAHEKIKIEGPYHALTNAGHITYIEMDGDPSKNLEAFESVVRAMHDANVGYGSINHPVDRDPVCGYTGIINETCPGCGRREDDGKAKFDRIRRITGYLVGTLDRFNDAKRAEEHDRVKHGLS